MTKIKKVIISITLIFLTFLILINSKYIIDTTIESLNVFLTKVYPSLFIFFILIDFLINYNIISIINKLFKKPISKLFNISEISANVFVFSLLCGLPSNAKIVKDLLDNHSISLKEANKILAYTFFPSPMFIIGFIGVSLLNNITYGYKIFLIIVLSNIILGILIRNKKYDESNLNILKKEKLNFSNTLNKSINKTFDTLLLILGNITIFTIISNLISLYLPFNSFINSIVSSIFEFTSGIIKINNLDIFYKLKIMTITSSLSFCGLSVISQAISILNEYKIDYKFILYSRILSSVISLFLAYILF